MEIIPAILPQDYNDLREHLSLVRGLSPWVQVDITDGRFTPDASWPYVNDPDGIFSRIVREEEALPYWREFQFEVDLMVERSEEVVADWVRAGARRVIPHLESGSDIPKILADLREISRDPESMAYTEVGVAISITADPDRLKPFLGGEGDRIDFVQCMGIERIGYQGQEFDERVLEQLSRLRELYPGLIMSVDGGVSTDTVAELVEAGAGRLVSGSGVFENGESEQAIEDLRAAAQE